jgi:deazaflavin-dependent oxidoreductase (nitroreductase family)
MHPEEIRVSGNDQIIEEFRANAGRVGGFFEHKDLLLLHTTGARSGAERISPLVYVTDGGRYVVAASKGGADTHPDWYFNVKASQDVTIEVGSETVIALASIPTGTDRDRLYAKLADRYSFFTGYQQGTARVIPVITIEPME